MTGDTSRLTHDRITQMMGENVHLKENNIALRAELLDFIALRAELLDFVVMAEQYLIDSGRTLDIQQWRATVRKARDVLGKTSTWET